MVAEIEVNLSMSKDNSGLFKPDAFRIIVANVALWVTLTFHLLPPL